MVAASWATIHPEEAGPMAQTISVLGIDTGVENETWKIPGEFRNMLSIENLLSVRGIADHRLDWWREC
jgi:hypothetical protein